MAAASDGSGKVTCERFISWMFGCLAGLVGWKGDPVDPGGPRDFFNFFFPIIGIINPKSKDYILCFVISIF
jgi:hypothetical protein